ncbi:85ef7965-c073-44c5-9ebe-6127e3e8405b [Thermothielavioides terrestris]|uniref:Large ribosomal subunit protein mL40 n=1 Tax=Thermothielavioides terrestris TaxID=2587410 RepID=A0A3S4D6D1_9PEZI|nr:85ef7965-c073-44c5-9ebe-6127e3e8405b [Thermothielavioides terrestris]
MSFPLASLRGLASRFLNRPTTLTVTPFSSATTTQCLAPSVRPFSTSLSLAGSKKKDSSSKAAAKAPRKPPANQAQRKKAKGKDDEPTDPRIINMLKHFAVLSPRRIPPPLRMGRNRYLRHWTIHRAWMLFRRRQRHERESNLMRQYQSMRDACEELRLTSGPGTRPEGYLFRVAMEKVGVYGLHAVPIEYARAQTETPARVAWNHDWKR